MITHNTASEDLPEFSFFRLSLLKHLKEIHSEKEEDTNFITERCEEAEDTYQYYIQQGFSPAIAIEAANDVLLTDLSSHQ